MAGHTKSAAAMRHVGNIDLAAEIVRATVADCQIDRHQCFCRRVGGVGVRPWEAHHRQAGLKSGAGKGAVKHPALNNVIVRYRVRIG